MYATTREFLERFGLNDLSDLPKVEEMSEALGFELPMDRGEAAEKPSPLPFDADHPQLSLSEVARSLASRQLVVIASDYVLLTKAGRRALTGDAVGRD